LGRLNRRGLGVRIIAIDASTRRGTVSRSVELAAKAAEATGAEVVRIRLAEQDIRFCTGCRMCRLTGACKITDDLPGIVDAIQNSNGVIFGIPSYFRKADRRFQAVLDRISSFFPDDRQMRLPGFSDRETRLPEARAAKRAVIFTACSAPEPVATFFGYTTGPIRELRAALGNSNFRTVGSLAVAGTWRRPELDLWECDKAEALGRVIAGKI